MHRSAERLDQGLRVDSSRLRSGPAMLAIRRSSCCGWSASLCLAFCRRIRRLASRSPMCVSGQPPSTRGSPSNPTKPSNTPCSSRRVPSGIVLDLEGVTLDAGLEGLPARIGTDDPYIAQARVARNRPGVVRRGARGARGSQAAGVLAPTHWKLRTPAGGRHLSCAPGGPDFDPPAADRQRQARDSAPGRG